MKQKRRICFLVTEIKVILVLVLYINSPSLNLNTFCWLEGPRWWSEVVIVATSFYQVFGGIIASQCLCLWAWQFLSHRPVKLICNYQRSEFIAQVLSPVVEVDLLPGWEVIHQRAWAEKHNRINTSTDMLGSRLFSWSRHKSERSRTEWLNCENLTEWTI